MVVLFTERGKTDRKVRFGETVLGLFIWTCPLSIQIEIFNIYTLNPEKSEEEIQV